mmetsp:Transcript_15397/g.38445  ORF Transcript_15397/g.38445 Transcript_15397/m.38445 type:complete len:448 (-) Transcript_15397:332-1675(-)
MPLGSAAAGHSVQNPKRRTERKRTTSSSPSLVRPASATWHGGDVASNTLLKSLGGCSTDRPMVASRGMATLRFAPSAPPKPFFAGAKAREVRAEEPIKSAPARPMRVLSLMAEAMAGIKAKVNKWVSSEPKKKAGMVNAGKAEKIRNVNKADKDAPKDARQPRALEERVYKVEGGSLTSSRTLEGIYKTAEEPYGGRPVFIRTDGIFSIFWGGKGWWIAQQVGRTGNKGGVNAHHPTKTKDVPGCGWLAVAQKGLQNDPSLKVTLIKVNVKKPKSNARSTVRFAEDADLHEVHEVHSPPSKSLFAKDENTHSAFRNPKVFGAVIIQNAWRRHQLRRRAAETIQQVWRKSRLPRKPDKKQSSDSMGTASTGSTSRTSKKKRKPNEGLRPQKQIDVESARKREKSKPESQKVRSKAQGERGARLAPLRFFKTAAKPLRVPEIRRAIHKE